jgi:hypothetical protein
LSIQHAFFAAVGSHLTFNTDNGDWERFVGYLRSSTINMVLAKDGSGRQAMPCDVSRTRVHYGRTELCIVVQKHIRLKVGCIFLVSKGRYCFKVLETNLVTQGVLLTKTVSAWVRLTAPLVQSLAVKRCALKF